MTEMPILTSGRFLAQRGLVEPPEPGFEGDWAALITVEIIEPVEGSIVGRYWSSGFDGFLSTGDVGRLDEFDGERIGGFPLMVDPELIERWYFDHGPVDVADYYRF